MEIINLNMLDNGNNDVMPLCLPLGGGGCAPICSCVFANWPPPCFGTGGSGPCHELPLIFGQDNCN